MRHRGSPVGIWPLYESLIYRLNPTHRLCRNIANKTAPYAARTRLTQFFARVAPMLRFHFARCRFDLRAVAALACSLLPLIAAEAQAKARHALLIANQNYAREVGKLANPINDVRLLAKALGDIGFAKANIRVVANADRVTILSEVADFGRRLGAAGEGAIGFFYYSGHGAANNIDRRNYIIPVGAARLDDRVWFKSVALDSITRQLSTVAPNAAHFVVFDACRNVLKMPTRGAKGFQPVRERRGMLIAFSTEPGQTASDAGRGSGPYASALAGELRKPGLDHLDVFQNVKEQVYRETRVQVPWTRDGLLKRVTFAAKAKAPPKQKVAKAQPDVASQTKPKRLGGFANAPQSSAVGGLELCQELKELPGAGHVPQAFRRYHLVGFRLGADAPAQMSEIGRTPDGGGA